MCSDFVQKRWNRTLVRVAMQTAVVVQTAIQVESEKRHMQMREAAFRRLVAAEQREKRNEAERRHKGKSKSKGKSSSDSKNQQTERDMTEMRSKKGNHKHEGVQCENASELRYEKKAHVIRYREPKIPWQYDAK